MATTTEFSAGLLSDQEHRTQLRRAVIASAIGTAIEWYDFFLYSTVTGLVFAKLFFSEVRSAGRHLMRWGLWPVRSERPFSGTSGTASGANQH
jgi:hypothetical protein